MLQNEGLSTLYFERASLDLFYGFITSWICEINTTDWRNVLSSMSGYYIFAQWDGRKMCPSCVSCQLEMALGQHQRYVIEHYPSIYDTFL